MQVRLVEAFLTNGVGPRLARVAIFMLLAGAALAAAYAGQ